MARYWSFGLKWLVTPILTILSASFLVFTALSFTPGDPVAQILGGKATPEQRELMRAQLGLDDPLIVRYFTWLGGFITGDLGTSYAYRDSVIEVLAPRISITIALILYAGALIIVLGVLLGVIGGLSPKLRPFVSAIIAVMLSIPSYVSATVLLGIFAVSLAWFPTFGAGTPGPDRIWHLTLPAVALAISWVAYMAQISLAAVSDQRSKEHVRTAVGRGLGRGQIVRKHILRNAGTPIITASGLTMAGLVAGSVIVESAFTVDGVGSLLVRSVSAKDVPVVVAVSVLIVVIFVVVMTLVDVLQSLIDPTLRRKAAAR